MTVKEAITILSAMNPEDNIILAFWEHECFPFVPKENWAAAAENAEDETNWSHAHEILDSQLRDFLVELPKLSLDEPASLS